MVEISDINLTNDSFAKRPNRNDLNFLNSNCKNTKNNFDKNIQQLLDYLPKEFLQYHQELIKQVKKNTNHNAKKSLI